MKLRCKFFSVFMVNALFLHKDAQKIAVQISLACNLCAERVPPLHAKKEKDTALTQCPFLSDSLGARTQDPNIKSVVLYLLS